MEQNKIPFQKIVFVCVNQRQPHEICCAARGSDAIATALKARIKALGLSRIVRVSRSGCQDLCARGPNVMVFPDQVWYEAVTIDDVGRIARDILRNIPQESASHPGL